MSPGRGASLLTTTKRRIAFSYKSALIDFLHITMDNYKSICLQCYYSLLVTMIMNKTVSFQSACILLSVFSTYCTNFLISKPTLFKESMVMLQVASHKVPEAVSQLASRTKFCRRRCSSWRRTIKVRRWCSSWCRTIQFAVSVPVGVALSASVPVGVALSSEVAVAVGVRVGSSVLGVPVGLELGFSVGVPVGVPVGVILGVAVNKNPRLNTFGGSVQASNIETSSRISSSELCSS